MEQMLPEARFHPAAGPLGQHSCVSCFVELSHLASRRTASTNEKKKAAGYFNLSTGVRKSDEVTGSRDAMVQKKRFPET